MEPRHEHPPTDVPDPSVTTLSGTVSAPSGPASEDVFRLALSGEIDIGRDAELSALVDAFLDSGSQDVLLDLSAVEFLDSSGLSALSRLRAIAVGRGGMLRLLAPQAPVRRVLDVSGVSNVCEIID